MSEEVSDPLKLKLEMSVGCHVGAGNQTRVYERAVNIQNCQAISLAPRLLSIEVESIKKNKKATTW